MKKKLRIIICTVLVCASILSSAGTDNNLPIDFGIFEKGDSSHAISGHTYEGSIYSIKIFSTSDNVSTVENSFCYFLTIDISERITIFSPDGNFEPVVPMKNYRNGAMLTRSGAEVASFGIGAPYGMDQYILVISKEPIEFSEGLATPTRGARLMGADDIKARLLNSPYSRLKDCFIISKSYESHPKSEKQKI